MTKSADEAQTGPALDRGLAEPGAVEPLDLRDWIPYRCSVIANHVSACLESLYGERYGLSVAGWRVMANLASHAPLSAKEVARRAAMDPVQATRTIKHVESLGFVSRRIDADDRRRVVLRLSRKGWAAYREIAPLAREIERALLAGFSDQERALLDALSGKLLQASERILAPDPDWRRLMSGKGRGPA